MFLGTVPNYLRSVFAGIASDSGVGDFAIGCSGNLTIEHVLYSLGIRSLHSCDVSSYTTVLAQYFIAGRPSICCWMPINREMIMPYRINPQDTREVQVQRNGRWMTFKRHETADDAIAHLRALLINIPEARRGRKR